MVHSLGYGPMRREFIAMIAGIAGLPLAANAQQAAPSVEQNGAALYSQYCSQCHEGANTRAPSLSVLRSMPLEQVVRALSTGSMASIAQERTSAERTAIASFIAAKAPSTPTGVSGQCAQNPVGFAQRLEGARWNGWGSDVSNSRFQSAAMRD